MTQRRAKDPVETSSLLLHNYIDSEVYKSNHVFIFVSHNYVLVHDL